MTNALRRTDEKGKNEMSGPSFVQAVVMWLLLVALGGILTAAAVFNDAVWALVLLFALVWIPLTLRWAWLVFLDFARDE